MRVARPSGGTHGRAHSILRFFAAFDVRTSAVRAVKRLHWQELVRRLPDMERSFNQEISLMMSLNNPKIVKLYDQIVRAPLPYLVSNHADL